MPTTCARCGSDKIIDNAKVEDHISAGRRAALEVLIGHQEIGGIRGYKPVRFSLKARICGACGFTDMYVSEPAKMWRIAQKLSQED